MIGKGGKFAIRVFNLLLKHAILNVVVTILPQLLYLRDDIVVQQLKMVDYFFAKKNPLFEKVKETLRKASFKKYFGQIPLRRVENCKPRE